MQSKIVETSVDQFGLKAEKLERMYKKHAKKDFMDGIRVFPEDLVYGRENTKRAMRLVSDSDDSGASDLSVDSGELRLRAEKRLARLLQQSSEDPYQQDVIEDLPSDARKIYDNPDLLVSNAERRAKLLGKTFQKNQHIAVSDYLKDKIHDSKTYKIQY